MKKVAQNFLRVADGFTSCFKVLRVKRGEAVETKNNIFSCDVSAVCKCRTGTAGDGRRRGRG